jgi:hypothetical protein
MLILGDLHLLQLRLYTPDEEIAQLYALVQQEHQQSASWRHREFTVDELEFMTEHLEHVMTWHEKKPPEYH